MDDVIAKFGSPNYITWLNHFMYFNNDYDRTEANRIEFSFKDKKVTTFTIANYVEDSKQEYTTLFQSKSSDREKIKNVVKTYKDKVNLNGKPIAFPSSLDTLGSDYAFDQQAIDNKGLYDNNLMETGLLYKGEKIMTIKVNTTVKERDRKSKIVEFIMKKNDTGSEKFDLDGIKIGMSRKEVDEKFGKPSKIYRENLTNVLIYDYFSYSYLRDEQIRFGFEKDVLTLTDILDKKSD